MAELFNFSRSSDKCCDGPSFTDILSKAETIVRDRGDPDAATAAAAAAAARPCFDEAKDDDGSPRRPRLAPTPPCWLLVGMFLATEDPTASSSSLDDP